MADTITIAGKQIIGLVLYCWKSNIKQSTGSSMKKSDCMFDFQVTLDSLLAFK